MPKLNSKLSKVRTKGYNGFPEPKKVSCSECGENFLVKFVISRLDYSQKNNWGYWTEKEQDQKVISVINVWGKFIKISSLIDQLFKTPKKEIFFGFI